MTCLLLVACGSGSGGGTGGNSSTGTPAPSASITVFAAASLAKVMPIEIHAFEAAHPGLHVAGDYEGTQALLTKLEADDSLADVFVSADRAHMATAQSKGLVAAPRQLASNTLVIAVAAGRTSRVTSLAGLAAPGVRLSVADKSVPAGAYAEQAFEIAESNHDAPAGYARAALANVVTRPTDVETVVANVAAGVVDAGIVYATDVKADSRLAELPIPPRDQPETAYMVAVTAHAPQSQAAQQFVDFLFSTQGRAVLQIAGFGTSPGAIAQPLGGAPARSP